MNEKIKKAKTGTVKKAMSAKEMDNVAGGIGALAAVPEFFDFDLTKQGRDVYIPNKAVPLTIDIRR